MIFRLRIPAPPPDIPGCKPEDINIPLFVKLLMTLFVPFNNPSLKPVTDQLLIIEEYGEISI